MLCAARVIGGRMQRADGIEFEARGEGEPVVTIHGAIVADSFGPLMDEPSLGGYRVVRYRRRGYGASDPTSSLPTIKEHADDALSLLDHLGIRRAHVIAHSGGGPIAVQLAIDAPDRVRSLVLLEPALQSASTAAAFSEFIAPLVDMHRSGESSKAVHLWMRATGGSDWRSAIEQRLPGAGDRAIGDAAGTFDGDLVAMRSWDFDAAGAARITQPVLYLVGSQNAARVEPVTAMFRAAVPHTELVVIDDADHNLQITKPAPVAETIADFLHRHAM